jgi:hypothetical protein
LDRPPSGRVTKPGADTAVPIEREVVFGHAYAILAPYAVTGVKRGYDNPTNLSVMVLKPVNPGPRRVCAGALVMERC